MIDLERLRKSATAIFMAVDEPVAKDISQILIGAITEIEALRARNEKLEEVWKAAKNLKREWDSGSQLPAPTTVDRFNNALRELDK